MTRMQNTQTATLAVAADYADALMTARRAKNVLFLALLLFLIAQLALFLLVRPWGSNPHGVLKLEDRAGITPVTVTTTTAPTAEGGTTEVPVATTQPAKTVSVGEILRYVIPVMDFLGVVFVIVLAVVLLLLTGIMLVGRLIGVSHVTSAFIWSVLLVVFLFPWQAFLISSERYETTRAGTSGYSASDPEITPQPAFKIPGVLYTYPELRNEFNFPNNPLFPGAILKWGRYVGFPLLAMLVLLMVQAKSSRGLRFALGEADIHVEVATRSNDPLV